MNDPSSLFSGRRLLITSCTRRKKRQAGVLPAWERYEGGCFPLLKQLQTEQTLPSSVDIFIISAKYGLLRPEDCIEFYDQRMTREPATLLQPDITNQMRTYLTRTVYTQTCILLEASYMLCLHGLDFPDLTYLDSFSMQHLRTLEQWLLQPTANYGEADVIKRAINQTLRQAL